MRRLRRNVQAQIATGRVYYNKQASEYKTKFNTQSEGVRRLFYGPLTFYVTLLFGTYQTPPPPPLGPLFHNFECSSHPVQGLLRRMFQTIGENLIFAVADISVLFRGSLFAHWILCFIFNLHFPCLAHRPILQLPLLRMLRSVLWGCEFAMSRWAGTMGG